jgi:AraC-like DNA-binding protein
MHQESALSSVLKKIAQGSNVPYFCHTSTTTPNMQVSIQQIINCPYQGLTKKIFLESKALELLAYKLNQMDSKQNQAPKNPGCSPDAVEKIHFAKEILLREMESPPSLLDLGKTVGLSRTKLHTEFCRTFGITPFAFLRDARLNKAKLYLDEGIMNVTEAAMAVGYSSISHFAKAFKRHFGVAPSDCQGCARHFSGYQDFPS